jgi:hypothetical protein
MTVIQGVRAFPTIVLVVHLFSSSGTKMDWKKVSFYAGMTIVVGTHVAMLPDLVPMATYPDRRNHAIANLVGAGLILYGTL